MTQWHGIASRIAGLLWGESFGYRWIPLKKSVMSFLCCNMLLNKQIAGDVGCHYVTVMLMCFSAVPEWPIMPMKSVAPGRVKFVKQEAEVPQGQTPDCTPLSMSNALPHISTGNGVITTNGRVPDWHGIDGMVTYPAATNGHRSKRNNIVNKAESNGCSNVPRGPQGLKTPSPNNPLTPKGPEAQKSSQMAPPLPVGSTNLQPTTVPESAIHRFQRLARLSPSLQSVDGDSERRSPTAASIAATESNLTTNTHAVRYSQPPQRISKTSQGSRPAEGGKARPLRSSRSSTIRPPTRDGLSTTGRTSRAGQPSKSKRVSTVARTSLPEVNMPGKKGTATKKGEQLSRKLSKTLSQAMLDPMAMLAAARKSHLPGANLNPEEKAQYQHVLSGKLTSLPVQKSKVVRIFLSSTFTGEWKCGVLHAWDGGNHDDVIKWKHFPRNWPFVRGIHRSRWIPHTKASDAEL